MFFRKKKESFPFISAKRLELKYIFNSVRETIGGLLFLILSGYVFFLFFRDYYPKINFVYFTILVSYIYLGLLFSDSFELIGTPLERVPSEHFLKYTKSELKEILEEVCSDFNLSPPLNMYISKSKRANALVLRSSLFYFIPIFNSVSITLYLVNTLDRDELKAILAHEVSHVRKYPTLSQRFFAVKLLLFSLWGAVILSYLYLEMGLIQSFLFFLLLILLIFIFSSLFGLLFLFFYIFVRKDNQEIEALCDYSGAKAYGVLPMINGLLKLGAREEIFYYLYSQFSPRYDKLYLSDDSEFDTGYDFRDLENQKIVKKNKEALSYAEDLLSERLPYTFVSLEEFRPVVEEVVQEAIKKVGGRRFRHRVRGIIRWQKFDNKIKNLKIDPVEYDEFVRVLKKFSQAPLFYSPDEFNEEEAKKCDHPPLRNRILFLIYNLELPNSELKLKA